MNLIMSFLIVKSITASPIFPTHVDLEKIGEVTLNNEEYKILRPTTHIVRDAFEDFVLRRDTSDFPTDVVLLDDNGMRHYWTGLEERLDSIDTRKDLEDEGVDGTETSDDIDTVLTKNIKDHVEKSSKISNNKPIRNKKFADVQKETLRNNKKTENKPSAKSTPKPNNNSKSATKPKNNQNSTPKPKTNAPANSNNKDTKKKEGESGGKDTERTIAKTTFFCPFLGVITMQSYLDGKRSLGPALSDKFTS